MGRSVATKRSRIDRLAEAVAEGKRVDWNGRMGSDLALLRLRRRFGKLLRTEVAHTVGDRRSVNDEIRFLLSTFET